MTSFLEHNSSIVFFLIGFWVVVVYGWERFNEPSFPNQETLPRAVEPLRYLFLRPTYGKARFTYVAGLLLFYGVLVAPGASMLAALGVPAPNFPPQAWALLVALFLVGLAPNSNVKWFTMIEEQLRRWVHAWALVPDGVKKTIGVLEDALYEPPASQLNFLQSPLRKQCQEDLKLPPGTLQHRWARATILINSLQQMGAGTHPLRRGTFEPFQDDFEAILVTYLALKQDVQAFSAGARPESESNLNTAVNKLLKRIYAYISWGVRYQANSDREVHQTLEALGFRIPAGPEGRHVFDIVIPAVLLVALFTTAFCVITDTVTWALDAADPTMSISKSVISALTSAMAASLMYGSAVFIAINRRTLMIEQKAWNEGSPRCLIPIAIKAGLVTWLVIIASTVFWQIPDTWRSITGLLQVVTYPGTASQLTSKDWFLPIRIATALPWLLVGATLSAVLASSLSGGVRRIEKSHRTRDAIILAIFLGIAAAMAQLIQACLSQYAFGEEATPFVFVPLAGLAGVVCGAVIGFMVPQACRANLVTPLSAVMARALRDLLHQAERSLGSKVAAQDWVFMPNSDLGGITPAEAVQHQTQATGVWALLESEASRRREEACREGLAPVVIDGGLAERPANARAFAQ